jgi:peptide/nickel transport system substrate-binding protein
MRPTVRLLHVSAVALLALLTLSTPPPVPAADGELRWGLHVTLAARWLDPAETEAFNTPYMVMYAVHDALVKPMAAGMTSPSLARAARS